MTDLIVNEQDTVTRCRVEGCRITRPGHHKFRPKKADTATCKSCGTKNWHPNHAFEPGYTATNEDILAACSCGTVAKYLGRSRESHDHNVALYDNGWKLVAGEWKCPADTQKAENRAAKKAAKADPRQGALL